MDYRLLGYLKLFPDQKPSAFGLARNNNFQDQEDMVRVVGISRAGRAHSSRIIPLEHRPEQKLSGTYANSRLEPLGNVEELGDLLIHHPIQEVIVIYPSSGGNWLRQVILDCEYLGVTLRDCPRGIAVGKLGRNLQTLYRLDALRLPTIVTKPRHLDSEALL